MTQFVIMLNHFPKEVLPVGFTREQANERALAFKEEFLAQYPKTNPNRFFVLATEVKVYEP